MLVHLKVLVDQLVLMVRISVRVVLQKSMGYLEKKCLLTLRILVSYRCYWTFLGRCWWGLFWWWLISNFKNVFE